MIASYTTSDRHFRLADDALVADTTAGKRLASIALPEVSRVRLYVASGRGYCIVTPLRGRSISIVSPPRGRDAAPYASFIRALHDRLAIGARSGPRIFVAGHGLLFGFFVVLVVLVVMWLGLVAYLLLFRQGTTSLDKLSLASLAPTTLALITLLSVSPLRPRPYDPHDVPAACLPSLQ